ncbi:hypothetical protein Acr_18g0006540 [Actinidia rufa]|uniref:Uncharacterized protein n=1 Tax=Actinidia rufa TaxID=165716 RepID=A0A7J0G6Q9_9ERIC|nr:hypothetical protein Acr_18g0006540 [Actinidia rufa]
MANDVHTDIQPLRLTSRAQLTLQKPSFFITNRTNIHRKPLIWNKFKPKSRRARFDLVCRSEEDEAEGHGFPAAGAAEVLERVLADAVRIGDSVAHCFVE